VGSSASAAGPVAARAAQPSQSSNGDRAHRQLPLGLDRLELPAGAAQVEVALPTDRYVTVGLLGPAEALLSWQVQGPGGQGDLQAHTALDDDGLLPVFVTVETGAEPSSLRLLVETDAPARLVRTAADPEDIEAPSRYDLKLGKAEPRPIIGLPLPLEPRAGYLLEAPSRYLFLRADIAAALRAALRQTRIRFRRNAISVGDGSQWDGLAPGTDRGKSQHIGHRYGTEVDIGLPSDDDSPSTIQRRCDGVLVERDELRCAPGTVRHVDAYRLAYFLGLLIDGPTPRGIYMPKNRPGPLALVKSILTDEAYVDEIRKAAERLRRRRWIHDEGYGALVEEGLLRPSPWHTDHVHIRFDGEPGRVLIADR
jgi:hypothetical protein